MELQYISDSSGKPTAVIVPIAEWNDMTAKHEDLKELIIKPEQILPKKKPSDYKGTMSNEEAEKLRKYVEESRNEWERNF